MLVLCRLSSSRKDVKEFLPEDEFQILARNDRQSFVRLHSDDGLLERYEQVEGLHKKSILQRDDDNGDYFPINFSVPEIIGPSHSNRLTYIEPCLGPTKSFSTSGY